jgi:membrane-bound lytic murein transglycosylase D
MASFARELRLKVTRNRPNDRTVDCARHPARLSALAVAIALGGCQAHIVEMPDSTANTVAPAVETVTVVKSKPTREPASDNSQTEAKIAGKATPEPPVELLTRVRSKLSLPTSEEPAVQRELDWYLSHEDYLERVFTRSDRYLHYIVEELERRNMPVDLALLPVVESAFDPFAYSHGRAAGLWQIIPGTGARLGLTQNWWYDARRDVVDSTRGALDYLEHLHGLFDGDWLLAVAGYNAGEGNVARAIERAQAVGDPIDFWHISPYLPVETRAYVPRLLAITAVVAEAEVSGVSLPALANAPHFEIVATDTQIDMALAADLANISTDQLYGLNPGVNRWATDPDGPHRLLVPVASAALLSEALASLGERDRVEWSRHEVQAGETLGHLAERYGTTAAVLREVNDISGNLIRIGQPLMIPHAVSDLNAYTQSVEARLERRQNQARDGQRRTHEVRPGESLWSISQAYRVGLRDLAVWNAMAPGDVLSVGRQLVIWSDQVVAQPAQNERIRRITYTVRTGDSLSRISTRFRVSVDELLQWNEISPNQYLQPGQRLLLYVDVTEQSI